MVSERSAPAQLPAVSRRQFLGRAMVLLPTVGGVVPLLTACDSSSDHRDAGRGDGSGPRLDLVAPTGAYHVGTTSFHLIDRTRTDPLAVSASARELMVRVWYPAGRVRPDGSPAPWLQTAAAEVFRRHVVPADSARPSGPPPGNGAPPVGAASGGGPVIMGPSVSAQAAEPIVVGRFRFPGTSAIEGAAARADSPSPVLLWSPGQGDPAALATQTAEDLASHGFVVAVIDHTHEAVVVEFPGARLLEPPSPATPNITKELEVRVADVRFVLDKLTELGSGSNPDAEKRPVPEGLARLLDVGSVAVAGHSLGGATAANAVALDQRFRAGLDVDGSVVTGQGSARSTAAAIGRRPFAIVSSDGHGPTGADPTLKDFWSGLSGEKQWIELKGSAHHSFTDRQSLLPQLRDHGLVDSAGRSAINAAIGTVNPTRSVRAQQAYLRAFLESALRHGQASAATKTALTAFPELIDVSNG